MLIILSKILPVFLTIFLGALCGRKGIISAEGAKALKNAVINITLPAVLLLAFAKADYSGPSMMIPIIIFAACSLALLLGFLLCRILKIKEKLAPYITTGFEAGMLGYTLFAILYPDADTSAFALIDLGQVLFVFTVYRSMLSGKTNTRALVLNMAKSPVIWGILLGIILGATGLYAKIAAVIEPVAEFMATPTSVMILLSIGNDLVSSRISFRKSLTPLALRLVVLAAVFALVTLVNKALGNIMHIGALLLMFLLPAPFVLPIFANDEAEQADTASTLSMQTMLTLILFAVLAAQS